MKISDKIQDKKIYQDVLILENSPTLPRTKLLFERAIIRSQESIYFNKLYPPPPGELFFEVFSSVYICFIKHFISFPNSVNKTFLKIGSAQTYITSGEKKVFKRGWE